MSSQFFKILKRIAEGYHVRGEDDRFILVENPDANDVNGLDPYHLIDLTVMEDFIPPALDKFVRL